MSVQAEAGGGDAPLCVLKSITPSRLRQWQDSSGCAEFFGGAPTPTTELTQSLASDAQPHSLSSTERPRTKWLCSCPGSCRLTAAGLSTASSQLSGIFLSQVLLWPILPPSPHKYKIPVPWQPCSGPAGCVKTDVRARYSWCTWVGGGGCPAGGQREVQNPRGADVGGVSGEVPADLSPATPEGWSQASLREQAQRHKSMGSAAKCVGGRRQAGGKAAQATL